MNEAEKTEYDVPFVLAPASRPREPQETQEPSASTLLGARQALGATSMHDLHGGGYS